MGGILHRAAGDVQNTQKGRFYQQLPSFLRKIEHRRGNALVMFHLVFFSYSRLKKYWWPRQGVYQSRQISVNLMHKKVFKSKAATEMCRVEMLKRLKKVEVCINYSYGHIPCLAHRCMSNKIIKWMILQYFYCSECDVICQCDKQILLHLWLAHPMVNLSLYFMLFLPLKK